MTRAAEAMSTASKPSAARALRRARMAGTAPRDEQAVAEGKEAEAEATTDGMPERPADADCPAPAVVPPPVQPVVPPATVPLRTSRSGKTRYGGPNPTQPKEGL